MLRNFDFFGAPVAGILCMDSQLGAWDAMSVGLYLQTLLLALTERGLGTCCQVSVVGYPEILREILGIPEDLTILCGIAIGWPDEEMKVNHLRYMRDDLHRDVTFVDFE